MTVSAQGCCARIATEPWLRCSNSTQDSKRKLWDEPYAWNTRHLTLLKVWPLRIHWTCPEKLLGPTSISSMSSMAPAYRLLLQCSLRNGSFFTPRSFSTASALSLDSLCLQLPLVSVPLPQETSRRYSNVGLRTRHAHRLTCPKFPYGECAPCPPSLAPRTPWLTNE